MDKIDALIVFEQHIRTAEKHYIKEKENEDKRLRRHERKVREAFNGFLEASFIICMRKFQQKSF
jgi:hypothetical protein